MPLYPFVCRACEKGFEKIISRPTSDPTASCPECGSSDTERRLGVPAKGSVVQELPAGGACGVGPPCGAVGCRRVPAG